MIFFISVDISIYAGVFFFFIYLFKKIFKRQTETLTLANAVIIILAGASIVGGVKVCLLAFNKNVCRTSEIEQIYVFIGGFAVIWIAVIELYTKILKPEN
ncbi:MAG TPA: hypothetical protein VNB90_06190 [Cytophagaceae bacterium]|jgi:hypothetical protein|nr:hypothetical protein [Cytophagaceae bacterium]